MLRTRDFEDDRPADRPAGTEESKEDRFNLDLSSWDACFDRQANPAAGVSSLQEWIDLCG